MQNPIFNIHDVILLMTFGECLLLFLFQLILPATNRLATRLLGSFLICIAVHSASTLLLWSDLVQTLYWDEILLPYSLAIAELLKGPILLLYVFSLTLKDFKIRLEHIGHCLPILLAVIGIFCFQFTSSDMAFRFSVENPPRGLINHFWTFLKFIPAIYGVFAIIQVRRYKTALTHQYSHLPFTELGWLQMISLGFCCLWIFSILIHLLANTLMKDNPNLSDAFGITENYALFILMNALFINSFVHTHKLLLTQAESNLFSTHRQKEKPDESPDKDAIAKVEEGMSVHKYFLKSNLNIEDFARKIQLSVRDTSAVINKHYGTNFFEFMNSYRIEEAKKLLIDPNTADKTILDILLLAGFNSKSAFHRFFSRLVGMSPSEFRKQQNKKPVD